MVKVHLSETDIDILENYVDDEVLQLTTSNNVKNILSDANLINGVMTSASNLLNTVNKQVDFNTTSRSLLEQTTNSLESMLSLDSEVNAPSNITHDLEYKTYSIESISSFIKKSLKVIIKLIKALWESLKSFFKSLLTNTKTNKRRIEQLENLNKIIRIDFTNLSSLINMTTLAPNLQRFANDSSGIVVSGNQATVIKYMLRQQGASKLADDIKAVDLNNFSKWLMENNLEPTKRESIVLDNIKANSALIPTEVFSLPNLECLDIKKGLKDIFTTLWNPDKIHLDNIGYIFTDNDLIELVSKMQNMQGQLESMLSIVQDTVDNIVKLDNNTKNFIKRFVTLPSGRSSEKDLLIDSTYMDTIRTAFLPFKDMDFPIEDMMVINTTNQSYAITTGNIKTKGIATIEDDIYVKLTIDKSNATIIKATKELNNVVVNLGNLKIKGIGDNLTDTLFADINSLVLTELDSVQDEQVADELIKLLLNDIILPINNMTVSVLNTMTDSVANTVTSLTMLTEFRTRINL